MIVDVALFKKHSRTDDFDEDDTLIEAYLKAAEEVVINEIGQSVEDLQEAYTDVPRSIEIAIMQIAAHWYNTREAVATTQMYMVPATIKALLKPYTKL
jgi:uncharacterized phage protein (predicted DNA packaging)